MPQAPRNLRSFEALVDIVAALRGPQGCPWDKAQSLTSLTSYAIEEAHEYAESVEQGQDQEIAGELGDLLLQVVLNSQVAQDEGRFELSDVIESICKKMIRRHPHVFTDDSRADSSASSSAVSTPEDVKRNWERIKAQEKESAAEKKAGFGISPNLPSLQRAAKIGAKTRKVAFDWPNTDGVWDKIREELGELKEVLDQGDKNRCQEELGDLLFSVAQLARHLDLDPEQCLRQTNVRFEKRFFGMLALAESESESEQRTADFKDLPDSKKEELWQKSKKLNG